MKISDIFSQGKKIYSFEFFPPKNEEGEKQLFKAIEELKPLAPGYVSMTYGAGGSTREKTVECARKIKYEIGLETMAHLTCVGSSRDALRRVLDELQEAGIENILALRGDPPKGETEFKPTLDGFSYAVELIQFIKEHYSFCIGVAGYPEGHVEAKNKEEDWKYLKDKIEAGGDFIVTQLFFENKFYFDFVKNCRELGIQVPIEPGIMPISNYKQITRFSQMCGTSIPEKISKMMIPVQDDLKAVQSLGIAWATRQSKELLDQGAPGIHFYTLNRSPATRSICTALEG